MCMTVVCRRRVKRRDGIKDASPCSCRPAVCCAVSRAPRPCCRPAVVAQLPGLQNLLLSHNRLGGSLSCKLMGPALAELELAGGLGWVGGRAGAWVRLPFVLPARLTQASCAVLLAASCVHQQAHGPIHKDRQQLASAVPLKPCLPIAFCCRWCSQPD